MAATDVRVDWTSYDDLTGVQNYSLQIDGQGWFDLPSSEVSYLFANLSDGSHTVSVKAIDLAGNFVLESIGFMTDVTSPHLVIDHPSDGSMFAVDSIMVNWTAIDNATGLWFCWTWVDDESPVNVTGELNHTFSALSEGDHTFHVKAWDMVGNSQEKMVTVLVDTSAPGVDITYPASLAHLNSRDVTVFFDVSDAFSGVKEIWVKLLTDEDWTSVGLEDYYDLTLPADTTTTPYTFMVRAQDLVGNEATSQVQFFVDTVDPSIVSHLPATGANGVLRGTGITIVFSEEMNPSTVSVALSPGTVSGIFSWNNAKTECVFLPSSNLAYATSYTVDVSGRDLANNQLTGTVSWGFTTIAHVTGVIKDVNGNPIEGATVNMSQGTSFWVTALSDANGNVALDVPVGTYNLTISASGQKDLVRNDVVVTTGVNELEDLSMTPVDNWTWLIIVVVIAVIALLALYFLYFKKKQGAKPEEEPKADEESKGKK